MARPRPGHLPDFDNPPVVETVLSVQFAPLPSLKTAHLGLLWNEYRNQFPTTDERPPLEPVTEKFPEAPAPRVGLTIHPVEEFPVPRIWFMNDPGDELIQVQNGRFIKNWRAVSGPYPHYNELIRPNFDRDYAKFVKFLSGNQLGTARINQCEVSYINHIVAGQGWQTHGDFDQVFAFRCPMTATPPGRPEDLRLQLRFAIPDSARRPIGRLHVDLQPAFRTSDHQPMYVLNLTARGQIGDSVEFFDVGREWIVTAFTHLTTETMHKLWGINNHGSTG